MENPHQITASNSGIRRRPPLAIRFVSGRSNDGLTISDIRSHAMSSFRSRQRYQRQLISEQRQEPTAMRESETQFCRCVSTFDQTGHNDSSTVEAVSGGTPLPTIPSVRDSQICPRCGGLSLVDTSQLPQRHPPVPTFAIADFDPFDSMAIVLDHPSPHYIREINTLKQYAVSFLCPGPIKDVVFPEALRTPALLSSMLYMAYAHLSSVRGWSYNDLALNIKLAAISHINHKISNPITAMCTSTIASIAYLVFGTWAFGSSFEEILIHMAGIEFMIQKRGIESLGLYPFGKTIRKYLLLLHIILNAMNGREIQTIFDFSFETPSINAPRRSMNYESPLHCPSGTFEQIRQSKQCSEELMQVLHHAKCLVELLIHDDHNEIDTSYLQFQLDIPQIRNQLERIRCADYLLDTSQNDWMLECSRLTAFIMLEAAEQVRPFRSANNSTVRLLVQALKRTDLLNQWGDCLGILYWVLMIGSAASKMTSGEHQFLDGMLSRTILEIAFADTDFNCAVAPTRQFARMQVALST